MSKTKMEIMGSGAGIVGVVIQGLRNVETKELDVLMHAINTDIVFAQEDTPSTMKFLCSREHAEMIGNWFRDRGHPVTQ